MVENSRFGEIVQNPEKLKGPVVTKGVREPKWPNRRY
jgi:hypothetical protein